MARAPTSGGKTRLAPHVPADRLIALRSALLADTVATVEHTTGISPFLFFTPESCAAELTPFVGPVTTSVAQRGSDLGDRMRHALTHLLVVRAFGGAILVGTDAPLLTSHLLRRAADRLRATGGLVLGPADDGGYYLIGMTAVHDALFAPMTWGAADVLETTKERARQLAIAVHDLPPLYDVDTIEDLRRAERDLDAAPADVARHLRGWLTADSR